MVGAGTTTQELARRLARVPGLTVVTNSLLVAQALAHANRVEVVMTGGTLRERHGPVRSHHFEDQLATFCSEHETDSNPNDRLLSAVCAE